MSVKTIFALLALGVPRAAGFAPGRRRWGDELCDVLVTYANDGCSDTTPGQDKQACVAEMTFSGYGSLATQAIDALDSIPESLTEALGEVYGSAKCMRDHVQSVIIGGRRLSLKSARQPHCPTLGQQHYLCSSRPWGIELVSPSAAL